MSLSLTQVYSNWLESLSSSTRDTYGRALRQFCSGLDLVGLRQLSVQSVQSKIQQLNGSPNTQRTQRIAIRAFLKFAGSQGLCDKNLYESIEVDRNAPSRLPDTYVDFSRDRVINSEPSQRNRVILWLTIAMRCMISEILTMTWADVDTERNAIKVRDRQRRERTVFVEDPVWSELIALRQNRTLDDYVFHGEHNRRLNHGQVHRVIEKALEQAGVRATPGEVCATPNVKKREYLLL